jgi:hypothetical protein
MRGSEYMARSLPKEKGRENTGMKKVTLSIVCLLTLSFAAIPVGAQTRSRYTNRQVVERRYDNRSYYETRGYRRSGYRNSYYDNRSTWERSRDKITTGIGAGAGATVGAIVGGKKGAIIGAIAGGGGAALYTYVLRDKDNRRRRY